MNKKKKEVFSIIKEGFIELFEINNADITLEANLYEDLDIDSIDAVDLLVYLKDKIGKKPSAESFKNVRTVGDVVEVIYSLVKEK